MWTFWRRWGDDSSNCLDVLLCMGYTLQVITPQRRKAMLRGKSTIIATIALLSLLVLPTGWAEANLGCSSCYCGGGDRYLPSPVGKSYRPEPGRFSPIGRNRAVTPLGGGYARQGGLGMNPLYAQRELARRSGVHVPTLNRNIERRVWQQPGRYSPLGTGRSGSPFGGGYRNRNGYNTNSFYNAQRQLKAATGYSSPRRLTINNYWNPYSPKYSPNFRRGDGYYRR